LGAIVATVAIGIAVTAVVVVVVVVVVIAQHHGRDSISNEYSVL
jgi:hypothetical protein